MCNKAVDTDPSTIKFVSECHKNQEMCNRAVTRRFFVFDSIPYQYKTQEICDIVLSEDPFLIVYCPDITQKMFDEGLDDSLAKSKRNHIWFGTGKIIKDLFTVL